LTLRQPTAPPFGQMLQLGIFASFFRGLPTAKTPGARRVMNLPEYTSKSSSAPCRIPYVASPKGKRVEVRYPNPSYLGFAAMLMAGSTASRTRSTPAT
jgi:hypothetical protein